MQCKLHELTGGEIGIEFIITHENTSDEVEFVSRLDQQGFLSACTFWGPTPHVVDLLILNEKNKFVKG